MIFVTDVFAVYFLGPSPTAVFEIPSVATGSVLVLQTEKYDSLYSIYEQKPKS